MNYYKDDMLASLIRNNDIDSIYRYMNNYYHNCYNNYCQNCYNNRPVYYTDTEGDEGLSTFPDSLEEQYELLYNDNVILVLAINKPYILSYLIKMGINLEQIIEVRSCYRTKFNEKHYVHKYVNNYICIALFYYNILNKKNIHRTHHISRYVTNTNGNLKDKADRLKLSEKKVIYDDNIYKLINTITYIPIDIVKYIINKYIGDTVTNIKIIKDILQIKIE